MSAEAQELEREESQATIPEGKSKTSVEDLPPDWRDYIRALRRENKSYREKIRTLQEEVDRLRPLASKAEDLEKKYNQLVEKQREKLLSKLPEDKREKYKNWDVVQLEEIVSDFLNEQEARQASPGAVQGRPLPQKDFSQMTQEELAELRNINPSEYYKMLNDFISKKYQIKI